MRPRLLAPVSAEVTQVRVNGMIPQFSKTRFWCSLPDTGLLHYIAQVVENLRAESRSGWP